MVKVAINKNEGIIEEITIAGHAGYAAKGEDIVCAAVSSIAITSVNDINALDDSVDYVENDGYLKITVKKDTERDHWLTAKEALDYGIAGKIITSRSELK